MVKSRSRLPTQDLVHSNQIGDAGGTSALPEKQPASGIQVDVNEFDSEVDCNWQARVIASLSQPGFLVSVSVHCLLLIFLALLVLPSVREEVVHLMGSKLEDEIELDEVEIVLPEETPLVTETDSLQEFDLEESSEFEPESLVTKSFDEEFHQDLFSDSISLVGARQRSQPPTISVDPEVEVAAKKIQARVSEAGGKSGEVQFSLVWASKSDVDLHVISPQGNRVFYQNRVSRCRGVLDVDRNAKRNRLTLEPVENVRWDEARPVSGRFTVWIHLFEAREENRASFELMAKLGDNVLIESSSVSTARNLRIFRFKYFEPHLTPNERERLTEKLDALQIEEEETAKREFDRLISKGYVDQDLMDLANRFPHTDTAIEALKLLDGDSSK